MQSTDTLTAPNNGWKVLPPPASNHPLRVTQLAIGSLIFLFLFLTILQILLSLSLSHFHFTCHDQRWWWRTFCPLSTIVRYLHCCTVKKKRERPWYVTGWHLLCSFWPLPSVAATAAGSVLSLSCTHFVFSFRCWPMDNRGVMAVWIKSFWPAGYHDLPFTWGLYFICGVYVVGADALSGPWPYS